MNSGKIYEKIKYWLGGGRRKYRVKGLRVEIKGGGCGPFWGFAHFTDFNTHEEAVKWAKRWAEERDGIFVE